MTRPPLLRATDHHQETTVHRHTTTAAALLLAATLTACGSSEEPAPDAATPRTQKSSAPAVDTERAALEKSVRAYTKALFGDDGKAGYKLVSERCKKDMSAEEFAAMSKDAHHQYGALEIKNLSVDDLSGNLARVSYGVGVPQFEREAQPWTREDGVWKWDAC